MKVSIYHCLNSNNEKEVKQILDNIHKDLNPTYFMIYCSVDVSIGKISKHFKMIFPDTKIFGSTSSMGLMSHKACSIEDSPNFIVIAFETDEDSSIGVGSLLNEKSESESIEEVCLESIEKAERDREVPDFLWIMSTPGGEEKTIDSIQNYFGTFVPMVGGSAADNDLSGSWKVFHDNNISNQGLVLVSFFLDKNSLPISVFHSGYEPVCSLGEVSTNLDRTVSKLDNLPALEVYNKNTGNLIQKSEPNQNILSDSTMFPVARVKTISKSAPFYLLSHPERITEEGGFTVFTDISQGDELFLMKGTEETLKNRTNEILRSILDSKEISLSEIEAVLIVFCAGCMLHLHSKNLMKEVQEGIAKELPGKEFAVFFTFGEQGNYSNSVNYHGNLMISMTIFPKKGYQEYDKV